MRLRKKHWARPELEASDVVIHDKYDLCGKWNEEFGNKNPIHLELGCGMGGHISQRASENRNVNYVGIDLKDEVVVYALRKILDSFKDVEEVKQINARLMVLNIMLIDNVFGKNEVDRIYINFCNPWPKKSHNKRRLTYTKFLEFYKKFLKPECEIWFKSDNVELFEDSKEYFKESGFSLEYVTYDLHNSDFKDNIVTEYERKFTSMGMKTMFLVAKLKSNQ